MDKQTKRELKKKRKRIYVFLLVAFPVLIVLSFLLYYFVPSLKEHEWIVIAIVVAVGGFLYILLEYLTKKREEKVAKEPKKKDPFAD